LSGQNHPDDASDTNIEAVGTSGRLNKDENAASNEQQVNKPHREVSFYILFSLLMHFQYKFAVFDIMEYGDYSFSLQMR
jgi:hypothetical protein